MKNFNPVLFILTTLAIGILLFISFIAAFGEDEGTLYPDSFWIIFVRLFVVLRFPTHTLLWPIILKHGSEIYISGLVFNCIFYGLCIERFISLFKKNEI